MILIELFSKYNFFNDLKCNLENTLISEMKFFPKLKTSKCSNLFFSKTLISDILLYFKIKHLNSGKFTFVNILISEIKLLPKFNISNFLKLTFPKTLISEIKFFFIIILLIDSFFEL